MIVVYLVAAVMLALFGLAVLFALVPFTLSVGVLTTAAFLILYAKEWWEGLSPWARGVVAYFSLVAIMAALAWASST